MTNDEINKLRALCDAATPGPWTPDVWIETDGNGWRATGPHHEDHASDVGSEPGSPDEQAAQADARFIAAARTALPALLDKIEQLTKERDEAQRISKNASDETVRRIMVTRKLCEAIDRFKRYGTGGAEQDIYDERAKLDGGALFTPDVNLRSHLAAIRSHIANWDWAGLLRDAQRGDFDSVRDALKDVAAIEQLLSKETTNGRR